MIDSETIDPPERVSHFATFRTNTQEARAV